MWAIRDQCTAGDAALFHDVLHQPLQTTYTYSLFCTTVSNMPDVPIDADVPTALLHDPEEDAGSDTAGWYEFQYCCTLRHCLDLLIEESGLKWILCEWQADFVLGWADAQFALVSVKYREPNSGFWTIARLFAAGGFSTLYKRWQQCTGAREVRWMTNGGLDDDCRRILRTCRSGDMDSIALLATELAPRFATSPQELSSFLLVLRMDNSLPPQDCIRVLDVDGHVKPTLTRLGYDAGCAKRVYDSIVTAVRTASRSANDRHQVRWLMSRPGALDEISQRTALVRSRLLTIDDIQRVLQESGELAAATPPSGSGRMTVLSEKLREGDIVPTRISGARRYRRDWTIHESAHSSPIPGSPFDHRFRTLRQRVLDIAADAQADARKAGSPYGEQMYRLLRGRLALLARDLGVNTELLLGLTFDLTAHCEVWWSPEFDVDERLGA